MLCSSLLDALRMPAAAVAAVDFQFVHVGRFRGLPAELAAVLIAGFDIAAATFVLAPALGMIYLHDRLLDRHRNPMEII
jgi:hypothetical protein